MTQGVAPLFFCGSTTSNNCAKKNSDVALYLLLEPEWNPLPLGVKLTARNVSVGRLRGLDLVLPDASVAPRHFTLQKRGTAYLINVDASSSPTYLFEAGNETAVLLAPDAPRVLTDGSRIQVGDLVLRVHATPPEEEVEWLELEEVAKTLVKRALSHYGHPCGGREVQAALRELLVNRETALDPEKRTLLDDGIAPPLEEHPSRTALTLTLLVLGLILALSALYWLLLPDTPRSL